MSIFTTKKQKIAKYLNQKTDIKCAFDVLLANFLDGTLKESLSFIGIGKVEIHVDWLDPIKCIGIQGRYKDYYMDLQIYPNEFTISFNLDETDEYESFPLESKEQLFNTLIGIIKKL